MRFPRFRSVCRVLAFSIFALLPGATWAQGRPGSEVLLTLTVVVPRVVQLVVDTSAGAPDGIPVVRVISNDRAIRLQAASGVPGEFVTLPGREGPRIQHTKGDQGVDQPREDLLLVRFTQVAP